MVTKAVHLYTHVRTRTQTMYAVYRLLLMREVKDNTYRTVTVMSESYMKRHTH